MTVEASFVMIGLLFAIAICLETIFFLHDVTVGSAYLHRAVEIERRKEETQTQEKKGKNGEKENTEQPFFTGILFSDSSPIEVKENIASFTGKLEIEKTNVTVSVKKFEPEEFMRITSAFLGEMGGEKSGDIFSEGDSAQLPDY